MLEAEAADPSLEACIPDSEMCGRQAKVSVGRREMPKPLLPSSMICSA